MFLTIQKINEYVTMFFIFGILYDLMIQIIDTTFKYISNIVINLTTQLLLSYFNTTFHLEKPKKKNLTWEQESSKHKSYPNKLR